MYVIQSENGTKINGVTIVKNQLIRVLMKKNKCGLLIYVIASVIGHEKLVSTQKLKIVHAKTVL